MQLFRLPNRRSKSEGDVSTLLFQPCSAGVTAPVFVTLQASLPSFDPTHELYASPTDSIQNVRDPDPMDGLKARIIELEAQLRHLRDERSTLEQDLTDYRADLLNTRTELYSEMLRSARYQQRAMGDFRTIQKLEARYQYFYSMLVDIGIPHSTVDTICQVNESQNGTPDNILVDAIKDALNDNTTLLAKLRPVGPDERTPEHYQSALNLTLSVRKELKSQKKRSKFWKKLAQEDDCHANIITPSPSDISSIRQDLSPERQDALDVLIARRRAARYSENTEGDVFGCQRKESALDTLANSLISRPRRSIQDNTTLSSSFSLSSTSTSTTYLSYLSGLSRTPRDPTTETPTIQSRLSSTLSASLRRSSRSSSQSVVLSSINLNVSRSSSTDPAIAEETEQHTNPETGPVSMVTLSQDLPQNIRRASQGHGHHRMPSTASRRSAPTRPTRLSFRLSAFSPIRACRPTGIAMELDSGISGKSIIDAPAFQTPDIMTRLPDLMASIDADTPASSEVTSSGDTPCRESCALPKYGIESLTDLETRVVATPSDGFVALVSLCENTCARDAQFLDHVDCSTLVTTSGSRSVAASESSSLARDGHEREHNNRNADTSTSTIPPGESSDSLFTASASASASSFTANDTSAPTTPPTPVSSPASSPGLCATPPTDTDTGTGTPSVRRSMLPVLAKRLRRLSLSGTSPERERLVDKLRGLRSLSRPGSPFASPVWRRSPARPELGRSESLRPHLGTNPSPSPSPVKESGIPMLQRSMTIRALRTSVRKV